MYLFVYRITNNMNREKIVKNVKIFVKTPLSVLRSILKAKISLYIFENLPVQPIKFKFLRTKTDKRGIFPTLTIF